MDIPNGNALQPHADVATQHHRSNSSRRTETLLAAIYARVSTQEQAQGKASIPNQLELCHRIIDEKGWQFIQEYRDEGVSGHLTEERSGLQSLLRDARQHKFDLIVVKDFDRFARNKDSAAIIRKELKELSIQTFAVNTPVDPKPPSQYDPEEDDLGTIVETISDMRADLERKQIVRRIKMGFLGKAKAGSLPNRVPYGYRITRTLEGARIKRTIAIDEEQASRVRFVFGSYAKGLGAHSIVRELNRRGWTSSKGNQWTVAAVRYLLANPTYTGKVYWGWRHSQYKKTKEWRRRGKVGYIGSGNHVPIIDEQLFTLVQQIRTGRFHQNPRGANRSLGLLTGIAKCIRCCSGVGYQKRRHSRSKTNPNWKDTETYEYICTGYKYKGICSQRVMSAGKLETAVLDHVKNLYGNPKVQEKLVFDGGHSDDLPQEKDIATLDEEIQSEKSKIDRLTVAYERGLISLEEYDDRVQRIREETGRNHMEMGRLASLRSATVQQAVARQKIVHCMRDFDTLWNAMVLDERKLILRSIIKQIRAGNGRVEVDFIF